MVTIQPLSFLELPGFEIFTRDSYFKKFGKPAPPADPNRRPKAWLGVGTFWFPQDQSLIRLSVPVNENEVNIDGAGPFEKFVLAPTKTHTADGGPEALYNPLYLSHEADARALMAELGGSNLADDGQVGGPWPALVYDPNDPRREWEFNAANGVRVNAGSLLYVRHQQGVGSPGRWDLSGQLPTWVPAHPTTATPSNPWPKPCRALLPNEKIGPSGIFGLPAVFIDDGKGSGTTTAGAGGYTQADRDRDAETNRTVKQIATRFGL